MSKKRFLILLLFLLLVSWIFDFVADYRDLVSDENSISIKLHNSDWYTFTLDNLENNSGLEKIDYTAKQLKKTFINNNICLGAIGVYSDNPLKIVVWMDNAKKCDNLLDLSDAAALNTINSLVNIKDYSPSIYVDTYKFIQCKYYNENVGYYACDYYTVFNECLYTISFYSSSEFTEEDYSQIKRVLNSVSFIESTEKTLWEHICVLIREYWGYLLGFIIGYFMHLMPIWTSILKNKTGR